MVDFGLKIEIIFFYNRGGGVMVREVWEGFIIWKVKM